MGCEVGAYAWMQDNCPSIRIPHLYGFGFSNHRHFTHEKQRPWYIRLAYLFRRFLHFLLRYPSLSCYTANPTNHRLPTASMLLEYIGSNVGQMLSQTWECHRDNPSHKQGLFQSMAHIILSLARIPQPRIGSFQFHDNCTVTLTNRPLTSSMIILENEGTPRTIQRKDTYSCTESFVADMLTLHDNRFLSNPNVTDDDEDCRGHMAARTLLRAVSHHYIRREQRNGPFFLQLTDLHASNIFVDDEWNITCLLDLEWICALPIEMINVPYWLTGRSIDGITGEDLDGFNNVGQEFTYILEQAEHEMKAEHGLSVATAMDDSWKSNSVWFWHCIDSVNAMYYLSEDHIYPTFSVPINTKTEGILSRLWREDSARVVEQKMVAYERYRDELEVLYKEKGRLIANGKEKLDI